MPASWPRKGKTTLRQAAQAKDVFETAPSEAPATDVSAGGTAIDLVMQSLEDSKGEDIVSIDLGGKSALADYMVVVSGRSNRHVTAIADHLLRHLKEHGLGNAKVEGLQNGDWVLIDSGDVIVHIFRPEIRSFYNIEKMWTVGDAADQTIH
ncbi:ribosome silencing factor [Jiella sonneratiae]|uniref:Ribosomal silencing factor RsfS n=1 Tax=Jiella sonneratiae TaxID=2816856 RepID=A0ABS3J172_9HYPH|nr:ribosome silencing factor [Jiella sonneratiae]MBO0903435.1 ribosome silencing factor [Jiella sonneratiae]